MSYRDSFYDALAEYVRDKGFDVAEVVHFYQETREHGYCETCYYSETVVEIMFVTNGGDNDQFTYCGDMGEFIRDITSREK